MSRESDRMDDLIMGTRDVHCLHLIAPQECIPQNDRSSYSNSDRYEPGVYLKSEGHGASPIAKPRNDMRLLKREQALEIARLLDKVGKPGPHGSGSFDQGKDPDERYPRTYAELIERWYGVLARRLVLAIEAAESRRDTLRVVRAALTGETS